MDPDFLRWCLLAIIVAALILWAIPPKCPHPCAACDLDRARAREQRRRDAHNAWHRGMPQPGCPYCERKT